MKISYVTIETLNIKNWSGTDYFVAKALEANCELEYIDALKKEKDILSLFKKLRSYPKQYWEERSPHLLKSYANQIANRISPATDIIFSTSSMPLTYLDSKKPKVFYTDATYAAMIDYYDSFSAVSNLSRKEGLLAEQRAVDNCQMIFYSSDWAAQSAIDTYGLNKDKVKVIPFGANITRQMSFDDIKSVVNERSETKCNILFLGVDWVRKGGDLVLEAVRYLNEELNLPTQLHVVGIDQLPMSTLPDYVTNYGRISKETPAGIEKIETIIAQSHFLFVPSRAEAYGLVFCEAMAFGVPCVSTKTGGIPTIVKNQQNGIILHLSSPAEAYAKEIYKLFTNRADYENLSLSAFNDYQNRLNWRVAEQTMFKYLQEL